MRWLLIILAMTTGATAQECNYGSLDVMKLTGWSAAPNDDKTTKVTVTYKNSTAKQIEIVDASVFFADAVGDIIGGIRLARESKFAPGETLTIAQDAVDLHKVTESERQKISAYICTRTVVYVDGTKEKFE